MVIAAGLVLAVAWHVRRGSSSAVAVPAPAPVPAARAMPAAASGITHASSLAAEHVRQLDDDTRRHVADQIASYHAHHSAPRRPELPPLPVEDDQPSPLKTSIRAAMREVVPYLQDCYETALPTLDTRRLAITAHLTLTGDPDVGTLIEADQLVDDAGQVLQPDLDDCLRSTLRSLELPALAEGDIVDVNYPLRFYAVAP
jgi:hypothetical protein